jgi:hypothetical protein
MDPKTCDTCDHDDGRVCAMIASEHRNHPDNPSDLAVAAQQWATTYCDDETMRPLSGAPDCPGWVEAG